MEMREYKYFVFIDNYCRFTELIQNKLRLSFYIIVIK